MELEAEIGRLKTLEEAKTEQLLQEINNASGSTRFDGQLFLRIIDHVTMADVITFNFIGGLAMTRELPNNTKGKN